jgi:acetylornithine aminotransferase
MGLFEVYSLLDLEPVKAKGAYLWDKNILIFMEDMP